MLDPLQYTYKHYINCEIQFLSNLTKTFPFAHLFFQTIKVLNQRLTDLKKTLQKEFSSAKSLEDTSEIQKTPTTTTTPTYSNDNNKLCQNCGCLIKNSIIMDEVNFKYLKHVIVKFLTSREVSLNIKLTIMHTFNITYIFKNFLG